MSNDLGVLGFHVFGFHCVVLSRWSLEITSAMHELTRSGSSS